MIFFVKISQSEAELKTSIQKPALAKVSSAVINKVYNRFEFNKFLRDSIRGQTSMRPFCSGTMQ